MPRLSADIWETIRAEREAGASFADLAAKHGVTYQAIQKRAKAEGWSDGQDVAEVVRRKVAEKVVSVVPHNQKASAAAIEAAAEAGADIIRTHQAEWLEHRQRFGSVPSAMIDLPDDAKAEQRVGVIRADFEAAKLAKISAEMLKIRQEGERKAHGLEREQLPNPGQAPVVYLPSNGR